MRLLTLLVTLLLGSLAHAIPQTFINAGLKFEQVVKLDVVGQDATGTFLSTEYDRESGTPVPFTGKVVPTPKGTKGVRLEIHFDPKHLGKGERAPYAAPNGDGPIYWTLRIVHHHAHLFIPMSVRILDPRPGKWVTSEVEFEPKQ